MMATIFAKKNRPVILWSFYAIGAGLYLLVRNFFEQTYGHYASNSLFVILAVLAGGVLWLFLSGLFFLLFREASERKQLLINLICLPSFVLLVAMVEF